MARVRSKTALDAMGELPAGSEMLAWEVVFGESRKPMAIGNLLGGDVLRISSGCRDAFVHSLSTDRGYEDLYRALGGLRERLLMMEAVARITEESRRAERPQSPDDSGRT